MIKEFIGKIINPNSIFEKEVSRALLQQEKERLELDIEEKTRIIMQRERFKPIKSVSREATIDDYNQWLEGHIKNGGKITSVCDYPFSGFRVLESSINISAFFGANYLRLIIPVGIGVEYSNLGHSKLYFMDGFKCTDTRRVPYFKGIDK